HPRHRIDGWPVHQHRPGKDHLRADRHRRFPAPARPGVRPAIRTPPSPPPPPPPLPDIQTQSPLGRTLLDHILTFENYPVASQLSENGETGGNLFEWTHGEY